MANVIRTAPMHDDEAKLKVEEVGEALERKYIMGYPVIQRAAAWYHEQGERLRERAKHLYFKEVKEQM